MDIMLAEKKNFIYGNKDLDIPGCINNGISEKDAETIYDQMVDFAKYAFNKSHAAAYAAISMETAYLKCHYPIVYIAGLMTSVSDKTEKLAKYVAECRKMKTKVLPPDVNSSSVGFTVEDGSIRFGLNAVKKIGVSVSENIVEERKKNGKYLSVIDFIDRNPDLNSGAAVSLINAGALSFGFSRNSLASNIKRVFGERKKEGKNQVEGQISFFDMGCISKRNEDSEYFPDTPEYDKNVLLKKEKEATGIYLSGHPLDEYVEVLEEEDTIEASDLAKERDDNGNVVQNSSIYDGQEVVFGGMITENRIVTTKKGELMSFIKVEGLDGAADVVVFPKTYQECKQLIGTDDAKVLIKGKISLSEDKDNSILADSVLPLRQPSRNLWLRFKSNEDFYKNRDKVGDLVANYQGYDDFIIVIMLPDGKNRIRKYEKIADCDQLKGIFEEKFGKENVAVTKKKKEKQGQSGCA